MDINFCRPGLSLQVIQRAHEHSVVNHLGIRFTAIGRDFVRADMPVDERTVQPYGILHGGSSILLAETLGSVASGLLLHGTRGRAVGIEVGGSHLRAAGSGRVTGTCRPLKIGRGLHFWTIEIHDGQGRQCCEARLTIKVLQPREGKDS